MYRLAPDERPWEFVRDILGDRTGLRTLTRDVRRPDATAELRTEARLEVWVSSNDPAVVSATETHRRRLDGGTLFDTYLGSFQAAWDQGRPYAPATMRPARQAVGRKART